VADCLNEGGCVVADMWSARFLMESQQLKTGQVMEYQRDRERWKWGALTNIHRCLAWHAM
jgi:hypothetical protein